MMTDDASSPAPLVLSWSGGKDCLAALDLLHNSRSHRIGLLVASVARDEGSSIARVPVHELPLPLLEAQARALGIGLRTIELPPHAANDVYEAAWLDLLAALRAEFAASGDPTIVYGDLFLADIRAYRERLLARAKWRALFPLWERDTSELMREFLARGHKAIITSVDASRLDASFAGEVLTPELVARLPAGIDPCGERGEFHTFVFDGPLFRTPVEFVAAATRTTATHHVCDLLPRE